MRLVTWVVCVYTVAVFTTKTSAFNTGSRSILQCLSRPLQLGQTVFPLFSSLVFLCWAVPDHKVKYCRKGLEQVSRSSAWR
ncbi:hypothetical protein F5883DRAFT_209960 [Diaporthe sp. PMI_573]|nr:hypothetical protein F5883DRAFT_209960 [Diaporthaceae sp. PMI_573]